jgi:hypothetical protein
MYKQHADITQLTSDLEGHFENSIFVTCPTSYNTVLRILLRYIWAQGTFIGFEGTCV